MKHTFIIDTCNWKGDAVQITLPTNEMIFLAHKENAQDTCFSIDVHNNASYEHIQEYIAYNLAVKKEDMICHSIVSLITCYQHALKQIK
jgi:hypothetical protein